MSETPKPNSLAALAAQVQANADRYERGWRGEQFAKQLRDRRTQLDGLIERVMKLAQQRKTVVTADPKARVRKRRLNPAIEKIKRLEATVEIDIAKVVETDALDTANLTEALKEAEQALLEIWQKFAKAPKDITGADALADVPELEDTVRKLRATREQLEIQAKQLPVNSKEVATVRTLQQQLRMLSDTLQTHGYDDEVLTFLAQTRVAHRGVSLADCLKNPKLREWLESGKNASPFVILHKSALSVSSPLRT